ncbi:hypothetical protein FOA43_002451 [Brettanomyces nanus]|uniref:Uncharacterized protein n=1 Tax=Eeniella nana TaxID=13502 RepID=A0A875RPI9_EENNA|nr:uncharacterized protein FOA43_002451 [Brettanomyces nanus]QPG75110.1 hypothetical protein FOA43_002451 [Brettanomyces nanus]
MPTNTIIITDPNYLDPKYDDLLDRLIETIDLAIGDDETVQVSKLRFFNRVLVVFEDQQTAEQVYKMLQQNHIRCDYSLRDNPLTKKRDQLEANQPIGEDEKMPIDSIYLEPPPQSIQMKSPPASPYLEWVDEPEEAPDEMTMTDPKSLANILYEPGEGGRERVFKEEEMDSLNLGDGLDDEKVPILMIGKEEAQNLREKSERLESNTH